MLPVEVTPDTDVALDHGLSAQDDVLRAVDLAAAGDFVAGVLKRVLALASGLSVKRGAVLRPYRFYVLSLGDFGRHSEDDGAVSGGISCAGLCC